MAPSDDDTGDMQETDALPTELALDGANANREATLAMLARARRTVDIMSRRLDPPIYDDVEVCEQLRRMVLENPRARVRMLVAEGDAVARRGHRLVTLARRLSSYFEMRQPNEEHLRRAEAFMVVDAHATIWRPTAERFEGVARFADPAHGRDLAALFTEMWEVAVPDAELRELRL